MTYYERESRKWPVTEHGASWRLKRRRWWAEPPTMRERLLLWLAMLGVVLLLTGYWMGW